MRTTVARIAAAAGVSTATVDRVLNNRDGVRERTRGIVMAVATRLGYFGPPANPLAQRVRLDFVLPAGTNSFIRDLRHHIAEAGETRANAEITIHQIPHHDLEEFSAYLRDLRGKTDAVAIVALDRPEVREAANALASTGIKICTLVSDVSGIKKIGYVGVDNRAAGRLAGLLIGRFVTPGQSGKVALFAGSMAYRGHEEREMGFRSILAEEFSGLQITGLAEVNEDRELAYQETRHLLKQEDITAIYSIGGGNEGIARALAEREMAKKVVFIAHEVTSVSRTLLLNRTMDAVIDQNAKVQAQEVLKMLMSAVTGTVEREYPPRIQIVLRENIPAD